MNKAEWKLQYSALRFLVRRPVFHASNYTSNILRVATEMDLSLIRNDHPSFELAFFHYPHTTYNIKEYKWAIGHNHKGNR